MPSLPKSARLPYHGGVSLSEPARLPLRLCTLCALCSWSGRKYFFTNFVNQAAVRLMPLIRSDISAQAIGPRLYPNRYHFQCLRSDLTTPFSLPFQALRLRRMMFGNRVLAALLFGTYSWAVPQSVSNPLQIASNDGGYDVSPSIIRPSK